MAAIRETINRLRHDLTIAEDNDVDLRNFLWGTDPDVSTIDDDLWEWLADEIREIAEHGVSAYLDDDDFVSAYLDDDADPGHPDGWETIGTSVDDLGRGGGAS